MKIRIISEQFNKKLYDAKSVHPLQSWDWGQARQKMGIEVLRLGEFNNQQRPPTDRHNDFGRGDALGGHT